MIPLQFKFKKKKIDWKSNIFHIQIQERKKENFQFYFYFLSTVQF